jgi:hypothetical protein
MIDSISDEEAVARMRGADIASDEILATRQHQPFSQRRWRKGRSTAGDEPLEARLYRDLDHDDYWIAWSANIGWVRFPARPNGWAGRKPVVELEALRLREVSLAEAFNTVLIESFCAGFIPFRPGTEAASNIDAPCGIG